MPLLEQQGKPVEPTETRLDAGRPARSFPWGMVIRLAMAVAVVVFLVRQIDLNGLGANFDRSFIWAALLFQVPMVAGHVLYAKRHAILVRDPPIPLSTALEAIILSAALNIVIPGRIAEIVKATFLRSRLAVPLAHGLSAVLIERLFDVMVVGAIAVTGISRLIDNRGGALLVTMPIVAFVALLALRPAAAAFAGRVAGERHVLLDIVVRQCRHIVAVLRPNIVIRTALLTTGSWLAHFAALALFFHLLPIPSLSLPDVALVFGAIVLASALPALPAGLGVFEAAVVVALQSRGIEFHQALAVAVVLHVAELLPAALFGPIIMVRHSLGLGELARDAMTAMSNHRER